MTPIAPPSGFRAAEPVAAADLEVRALREALAVAARACDAARAEILPRFRRVPVETKRDGSPVTVAVHFPNSAWAATSSDCR